MSWSSELEQKLTAALARLASKERWSIVGRQGGPIADDLRRVGLLSAHPELIQQDDAFHRVSP